MKMDQIQRHFRVRERRFFAFVMHKRGMTYREIGKLLGCSASRASEFGRGCERYWFPGLCRRLDRGAENRVDKHVMYGVTLTYELGDDLPTVA